MIVCICEAVSWREIEMAAEQGASNIEEVSFRCGAGQGCGACHEQILEIINHQKIVAPDRACDISLRVQEINRVLE